MTADQISFLRRLLANPRSVGAVAPSSAGLARAMVSAVLPLADGDILELGPGTGVFTAALLAVGVPAARITAIEYDPRFAAMVRARCPGVRVIEGDAFNLSGALQTDTPTFSAVLSGLPLLNFAADARRALIAGALARARDRAPFVQFSYGVTPPVPADSQLSVERRAVIWRNLPPARVWVYRRVAS